MSPLLEAVAAGTGQPETAYNALAQLVAETLDTRLITFMEINWPRQVARRSFTNMPEAYPVSGEKPLHQDSWSKTVLERREFFVANTINEITEVFSDHALIQSLGCESCLNIPVTIGGKVRATLNCLDKAGHFDPPRIERARSLIAPGTLVFAAAGYLQAEHCS